MNFAYFAGFETAYQQAEQQHRTKNFSAAFQSYQAIIAQCLSQRQQHVLTEQALNDADGVLLLQVVELSILLGHDEFADPLLAAIIAQTDSPSQADYISLLRIEVMLQQGMLHEASQHLEVLSPRIGDLQAIAFTSAGLEQWERQCWQGERATQRSALLTRLYLVLGWLLSHRGRYHDALSALERGVWYAEHNKHALTRTLQLHIARVHIEQGALQTARTILEDLQVTIDPVKNPELTIRCLELTGTLNFLQGKFGDALNQLWQVVEICQHYHFQHAWLVATVNLAQISILVNKTNEAERLLQAARKYAQQRNDRITIERIAVLMHVAEARATSLVEGIAIAPSVHEMWRPPKKQQPPQKDTPDQSHLIDRSQSNSFLAFFEDRALAFYWYLSQNLDTAADILKQMREVFEGTDSELIQLKLLMLRGILAYYQEHFQEAETIFARLRPSLQEHELKPDLWQVQRFLGWCWTKLQHTEAERQRAKLPWHARLLKYLSQTPPPNHANTLYALIQENKLLLDDIANSLSTAEQAIYRLNKWTEDEEYLAAEIDRLLKIEQNCRWWRPWGYWFLWKQMYALLSHIDRAKRLIVDQTIKGEKTTSVDLTNPWLLVRYLAAFSRKQALLSFLVLPDRVLLICARRCSLKFGISPLTRLQIRNWVQAWHASVQGIRVGRDLSLSVDEQPPEERKQTQQEIAEALADGLQIHRLLKTLPKPIQALTIVADDSLHGFPFSAIVHEGRYLIERYALSMAYEALHQSAKSTISKIEEAILVGVSRGAGKIPSLPGTHKELNVVYEWLTQHQVMIRRFEEIIQDPATKASVLERLPFAHFFHIACHGTFQPDHPDQSGLVLIPAPEQVELVSLRDVSRLNLSRMQHITLSNCWSADSFIVPGRWIISLPETLWRAGAQSILGSLWPVNDLLAVDFMKRFYEYVNTLPRDAALQRTQLDCLAGRLADCEIDSSNPIFWAGFNLYGNPNTLNFRKVNKSF